MTAAVTAVDLQLGIGNTSTSGCEATDFAGFPAGNIALLQRGTCTFELKAETAAAAGAVGIVIFNQGNTTAADRNNIPAVTLTANNTSGIPVLGTPYTLGVTLSQTPGLRMRVFANTLRETKTTFNVLAETNSGNDNNVVMVGAHLDSVFAGPGINDNGSGSAAILEVAEAMQKVKPNNTVRFAWWGAEESGLVGSTNYVAGLSQAQRDNIALYLNFDMIGSPNLRPVRLRRRRTRRGPERQHPAWFGGDRGLLHRLLHRAWARSPSRRRSTDVLTTGRSSLRVWTSPLVACSRGPRASRRRPSEASTEASPASSIDPCYHAACDTFSNNNNDPSSTSTPMPSPQPRSLMR